MSSQTSNSIQVYIPREQKHMHTKTCTQMFKSALLIRAKGGNNPKVHQLIKWIKCSIFV